MNHPVYLDYAASTPTDPRVREVMAAAAIKTGNPSSMHAVGRELRAAIDKARAQVARLLDVPEEGVVFTSGATEANGLAIRGVLRAIRLAHPDVTPRILVSGIEHASVLGSVRLAEEDGDAVVDVAAPDKDGVITADAVTNAITPETVIVAVMWANNVLGTLQPVADIGKVIAAERARRGSGGLPIVFVCDAVQALRTEDVRPRAANVDILTISSHKIYGPKASGVMWIADGTPYASPIGGGGHEDGRRHGTENVAGIVGFGAAAELLAAERAAGAAHAAMLRERLLSILTGALTSKGRATVVGGAGVPDIVFLRFPDKNGDELALTLDMGGIAVSTGSACDAGSRKSLRVLSAILDEQSALRGGIRVSFGRFTTNEDIDRIIAALGAFRA